MQSELQNLWRPAAIFGFLAWIMLLGLSAQQKFVTIEGTEGVGKTTNIQFIQSWLHSKQLAYLCTR